MSEVRTYVFIYLRLYREVIRFMSNKTILNILKAVALYSLLWGLISLLAKAPEFPRSVVLINFMVAFIGIAGSRVIAKHMFSKAKTLNQVDDRTADNYYNTRGYESRIGAWASKQSSVLKSRDELINSLENFKKKYNDKDNVPRPNHWSGWNLKPSSIEFWLDGDNRIHERLKYTLDENNNWVKNLLSP